MYLLTEHGVFFTKSKNFSEKKFINLANVTPNSWISSILEKEYKYYFGNAIRLDIEYNRYYSLEFNAFKDYLIQRYSLFPEEISKVNTNKIFYTKLSDFAMNSFASQDNIFTPIIKQFMEKYT